MYSRDLQIKYLRFRSHVELNPDEDGMNRHDFDSHVNVPPSLRIALHRPVELTAQSGHAAGRGADREHENP